MEPANTNERSVRTIHLDDDEVAVLLDKLDEESESSPTKRNETLYSYRMKALVVHMQQPGSTITVPYLVPTRNISADSLSFLHGGFVHIGTRCSVQLITTYGTWDNVPSKVVRCGYVDGNIHEVTVQFDRVIDPSVHCSDAVHSRVLLIDDDSSTVQLATFHLEKLNAVVDHAENGEIGVELALKESYDIILMDMDMPVMDGFTAIKTLREKGYRGKIVAATALTQEGDEQRCLDAGCDKYISKPYTRDDLNALIQSLHEEPLFSSHIDDPTMSEMIDGFVNELPGFVRELEEALSKQDNKNMERIARLMKGKGTAFGFEIITETAMKLENATVANESFDEIGNIASSLIALCMQARSTGQSMSVKT